MKAFRMAAVVLLPALAGTIPLAAGAQEKRDTQQPPRIQGETKAPAAGPPAPTYTPPRLGAPGGRVGGGTRGTAREIFVLSVLAPDHTGLTIHEQPDLYWFISRPASAPVELTLVDPRATQPVLETRVTPPVQAGVHRVRLAEYGVRLAPGVAYQWYVSVVPEAERRSKDILAGGTVERVEPPGGFRARLEQAQKSDLPALYAAEGLWYDALSALSDLIAATPNDAALRRQRAALLAQVGLPRVGDAE